MERSPQQATRRAWLAALAAGAVTGCALPWQQTDRRAPLVTLPERTPVSFGQTRLRLVVAREGHTALDAAVRDVVDRTARELGHALELQDAEAFAAGAAGDLGRQLLVAVQAGVPPDGVLLLGKQAQSVRWHGAGMLQEVSGLMRRTRGRLGAVPEVAERLHVVAGNWYAVPLYQRLVGHWIRADVLASSPPAVAAASSTWPALRDALTRLPGVGWGIGPADTEDVDGWCWNAIHTWGGGLADRRGDRVTLGSPETAAALEWLAATFRDAPWRGAAHPAVSDWEDSVKNRAFLAGETAYTYTERVLGPNGLTASGSGSTAPLLIPAPAGPEGTPNRTVSAGGGAVWLLPRGARPDPVERLWAALLQPASQRPLWSAGGGFALPAFESGWSDAAVASLSHQESVRRYREQLAPGRFISYVGQGGPETAASQVISTGRLAARMLQAVAVGRPARDVVAEAHAEAVAVYREHGLPGQ